MRVCPKCETVNKDQNVLCANCQEYIGAVPIKEDNNFAKNMVEKASNTVKMRNVVSLIIFLVVYIGFMIYFATVCYKMYDSLYYWVIQLPWYIPCLILFIFPYNKVYQAILRKRKKSIRPLDENWTIFFRIIAILYLFMLCINLYNGLAGQPRI